VRLCGDSILQSPALFLRYFLDVFTDLFEGPKRREAPHCSM